VDLDFESILDKEIDEDARDIRQVVRAVVSVYPKEERALWLELLLDHGVGVGGYEPIARKHGVAAHWVYRELRRVKTLLRAALAKAGFADAA
jgi:hypothetical protein